METDIYTMYPVEAITNHKADEIPKDITVEMVKNYTKTDSFFNRTAARGIIRKGDKYLLIRSRYGDCKFPGGGVEEGEEYTYMVLPVRI